MSPSTPALVIGPSAGSVVGSQVTADPDGRRPLEVLDQLYAAQRAQVERVAPRSPR